MNFLGSEPVVLRSSSLPLRSETNSNWHSGEFFHSGASVIVAIV